MRVGRSLNRVVRGEKKKREKETWCLTNLNSNLSIRGKCGFNILAFKMVDERPKNKLVVKQR